MEHFKSLDPDIRAYALVGKYLYEWAFMETELHNAIEKALNLDALQSAIVTSNLQFSNKIKILRAVLGYSFFTEEERKLVDKKLIDLLDYSNTRNMVAHDAFAISSDKKAVVFYVYRTRDKLRSAQQKWTVEKFHEEYEKIENYNELLKRINANLDALTLSKLSDKQSTSGLWGGLFGLGLPDSHTPQPQGTLHSDTDPPTPEKPDETPPTERE